MDERIVSTVAVCGGSGAGLLNKAVFAGADVFVTGDIKYHEAQEALLAGIAVIDAGHFATEQPVVSFVTEYLKNYASGDNWAVWIEANYINKDVFDVY